MSNYDDFKKLDAVDETTDIEGSDEGSATDTKTSFEVEETTDAEETAAVEEETVAVEDATAIEDADIQEVTPRMRRAERKKQLNASKENSGSKFIKKEIQEDGTVKTKLDFSAIDKKKVLKIGLCTCLALALVVIIYSAVVIAKAPDIETSNIYSLLSQSSVLYDDEGNIIDTAYGDENRTIVEIGQIPIHAQNAFIALEDKTFRTHNGFNIIRIFGAIKDSIFGGGRISGTSTITQQLARNLYLEDKMFERSISRKLTEAYYSVILEKELSKDEILEAYLNTINFGCGYGIQTASQAYFSKDVEELTIAEAAALAAIPQLPNEFTLIQTCNVEEVTEETPNLIMKVADRAYLWNDSGRDRMLTCLYLMHDQGYINDEEYEAAKATEIKDMVNPNIDALNTVSNYFADYVITTVIEDLQEQGGYSYEKASEMVYNGGLQIYTTMDSQAQTVIEQEFNEANNYPDTIGYSQDSNGNILDSNGNIMLYAYSNYINSEGNFVLTADEFTKNEDGSVTIYAGKRLNIYNTTVQGKTDYSVEFDNMYVIEDDLLYTINGGYINIPQDYKSRDNDDNLVISAKFFEDYPSFFTESEGTLATNQYTLNQRTIQPQSAMVIVDNETGQVKAMSGGRKTSGRMLYNRAINPRQPGSSIKPLAVYSAALQRSFELQQAGKTFPLVDNGIDKQGTNLWGQYITAGSIVDDEPTTIEGRLWPKNSYSGYAGLYTFRTALQQSVNVCAVKILSQVGVDFAADLVEDFGITSLKRSGDANDLNLAALGLGGMTSGVSPLEMASAYTTFVNEGVHISTSVYTKVTTRNGDLLLQPEIKKTKVLDPGVAWIMRDVLRSVVTEGIAYPAAISGAAVCGKTGTTDKQYDIWFCGFTAKYSAALWIGNDVNLKLSSASNATASMWGEIMEQVEGCKGGSYPARPDNVIQVAIDTKSGLLATEASGKNTRSEYFTSGTQPTEADNVHQTVQVCSSTGYLATPSCPKTVSKTGLMRPYIPNEHTKDYKRELPHYYCNDHNPNPKDYPVKEGLPVTIVDIPTKPPKDETDKKPTGDKDNDKDNDKEPDKDENDSGSTGEGNNTGGSGNGGGSSDSNTGNTGNSGNEGAQSGSGTATASLQDQQ